MRSEILSRLTFEKVYIPPGDLLSSLERKPADNTDRRKTIKKQAETGLFFYIMSYYWKWISFLANVHTNKKH